MIDLAKIERVDLRGVWLNEATDFTPWLGDNIADLGEALGLELELQKIEAPVGGYYLDILATATDLNGDRDRTVIIENQLESTDHDHLGKLLTYAAGFDAQVVVWLTREFRDEHRQALDWLNQRTGEDTLFFGVVVELWKIDDSKPAPHFKLEAAPNNWSKQTRYSPTPTAELTERQKQYVRFWKPLLEELSDTHGRRLPTENKRPYCVLDFGFAQFKRITKLTRNGEARVELEFWGPTKEWNKDAFDMLVERREQIEIESDIGAKLIWERLDKVRTCRVSVSRSGAIDDSDEELEDIRAWMIDRVTEFPDVFRPHLEWVLSEMQT